MLHTQVLAFHELFKESKSLDEMIRCHNDQSVFSCSSTGASTKVIHSLSKLEHQCLLQDSVCLLYRLELITYSYHLLGQTTALHQAIISVLDMTLHFSDSFVAFAGDTKHDISRHTIAPIKAHRSRRLKRVQKNVIGFAQTLPAASRTADSSESESEGDTDYSGATAPSFSLAASSFDENDFVVRLDTMSSELDTLVRFIRRGVESLAAGSGQAASAFGIFAFALEDWDQ